MQAGFYRGRQALVNGLFSLLYGQPVQVVPKGYVGLAGAVVVWCMHEGQRVFVMLQNHRDGDGKARFVSCMGLGRHADMSAAMKGVVRAQLGEVFARSAAGGQVLNVDRVAAAPLFSYTEPHLGVALPVQSLVWVVQVSHQVVDLIATQPEVQMVLVPEAAMGSEKVSSTHRALWQAVQRQLPRVKKQDVMSAEAMDEAIKTLSRGPRVVH